MTHAHFTKEEMKSIEAVGNSAPKNTFGDSHYYEYYSAAFNKMLREKIGREDIETSFSNSGWMSWAPHTNCPNGYGSNFKVFEIVHKTEGFTEEEIKEMKLRISWHHDYLCQFDKDGKLRKHTGTGNITMKMTGKQYTTEGRMLKFLRTIAKDISFSVELEDGVILNYSY